MFDDRFCKELLAKLELVNTIYKVLCGYKVSASCCCDTFHAHNAFTLIANYLFNSKYFVLSCYVEAVDFLGILDA